MSEVKRLVGDNGVYLTRRLFREWYGREAPYCLSRKDKPGTPSLYRLYMECNDATEYEFAIKHLAGWEHWQILCNCNWFQSHLKKWRHELEVKLRSEAMKAIVLEGKSGGKNAFSANKFLVTRGYLTEEEKKGRGRPSKEEINREASRLMELDQTLLEGLSVTRQ